MYELGRAILLDVRRGFFTRAMVPIDAQLGYEATAIDTARETAVGSLTLEPNDSETFELLRELLGCRVCGIKYTTPRHRGRTNEYMGRPDDRPFAHDFVRRPELLWSNRLGRFELNNVETQTNRLYEPFMIAS